MHNTKNMKSILLLGLAREGSTRLKNKMTRELYNGQSLFDIYLKKFETLAMMKQKDSPFSDIGMAICVKDKKLWQMALKSDVPIIPRDKKSIRGFRTISELLSCLEDFKDKCKYVMVVNGCFPFLNVDTIIKEDNENYYIHFIGYNPIRQLTTFTGDQQESEIIQPLMMEEPLCYKANIKLNRNFINFEIDGASKVIYHNGNLIDIEINDVYESIRIRK